jgi:hypothetical protein
MNQKQKEVMSRIRTVSEIGRAMLLLSAALLLVVAGTGTALAQSQYGTVSGRVLDSTGATVPDAKLVLANLATNAKQEGKSGADGLYLFANVIAGEYTVTAEKAGFKKTSVRIIVDVAQRLTADISLEVGQVTETVTVSAVSVEVNTVSGDLSRVITPREMESLPLLTLNPYNLIALTAGAAQTSAVLGDARGATGGISGEGGGFAINGARTSAVAYLMDGGENTDTFTASPAQTVPVDAVEEFRVQTNNMTSEFGRNAAVTNLITKSGTNAFHGSAYEYYRGAALSTNPFDNNARGLPKPNFVRNQFGASSGGPIFKDKTFFFGSFEAIRVRSSATSTFIVPNANFLADAAPSAVSFLNAFGGAPTSDPNNCLTAQTIVETVEGNGAGTYAANPLINPNTNAVIPAGTSLLCRASVLGPVDAGGGLAQNTWLATGRIDHRFTQNTALFGRYAFARSDNPPGANSLSPYQGFNTGIATRSQNGNLTLSHTFSPKVFSETRASYNRFSQDQPLASAPITAPCLTYLNTLNTPSGEPIVFPGYLPTVCAFASLPSGGPQNVYQAYQGFTWAHGRHTFKFGGGYTHIRDNHTFGALSSAFERTNSFQGLLNGTVDRIQVAINPRGHVPGDVYSTATDGPFISPSFTRHYHYNETAFYGEDSVKLTRRLTVTAGLRWEYFGVLHSPDGERGLDANLFLNSLGSVAPLVAGKDIFQQVRDARFSRTTQLYRPDYNNFGPRLGFAYDVFGNGRTVVRGGYGLFYDRNFGNALFNVIQNPPNYSVITLSGAALTTINPNQFTQLGNVGGAALTITSSARMLDNNLRTAYSEQWNLTVEHDLFGKGLVASVSYVGTNGFRLYSLNNLNPIGGCVRDPSINAVCNPASAAGSFRASRLNQSGLTGMNRRGNEGFSRYNGLSFELRSRQIGNTGLLLSGNYTWAHSLDNESSFFGDSAFEGAFGFGFRDPYNPALDKSSSANDIRHRVAISGTWAVPFAKGFHGVAGQILDGWNLSAIYIAQTGGAFSVYDGSGNALCSGFDGTNFCYPVITGAVPKMTDVPNGNAQNSFALYDVSGTFQNQEQFCAGAASPLTCSANLNQLTPKLLSPRNLFRTPGIWNLDTAILKDFRLPWEGKKLRFRAELFNPFNHSNLYATSGSNQFAGSGPAGTSIITASRGLTNDGRQERRNIQLALRFTF